MKTQAIYEKIFAELRTTPKQQQTCLVAVNDSSVAVYPMEKRLVDIRRKAWRAGFGFGIGLSLALVLLAGTVYSLKAPVDWLRPLQGGSALTSAPSDTPGKAAAPASGTGPQAATASPVAVNPSLELQDEVQAIAYWHAALKSLPDDERLLFVGTFERYAQVLPAVKSVKSPDRVLVIRSGKLRGGNYLVLAHPHLGGGDFEAARQRVSRAFGEVLLKWNSARRYKALL